MIESAVWEQLQDATDATARRAPLRPEIAIVLGSGLGGLAGDLQDSITIPYAEIPHFPASTAPGHAGQVLVGRLAGRPVLMFSGRVHLYEGYRPAEVVFGVRMARLLGAETLIITNAAGGVNPGFEPGTLMAITDHINLTGMSPLIGPNESSLGVRFPDMSRAYDPGLRALADRVARDQGLTLAHGVYLGLLGPSYETPAEIRMARTLGADAVGMSTVLEVIAARHAGMRVLGISCITNMAAGMVEQTLTEEEVIETAAQVRDSFATLVREIVAQSDAG